MTDWPDYELLDFGDGRKLERFGELVLDRPCPTAAGLPKAKPQAWSNADARYLGDRTDTGKWNRKFDDFVIHVSSIRKMQLAALPSGQIGIFPEQHKNWEWIPEQVGRQQKPVRVLNLFAYTGGSTLAAAAAGAEVTHVDSAKSMVSRARHNAEISELADRPIRWIVEDSVKFCQREVKRSNQYDAVILDPPSYGHGPKGESWSIKRDLLPLLELCGQLTHKNRLFILLTCHTPDIDEASLSAYLSDGIFGHCGQSARVAPLRLNSTSGGRQLPSGTVARWPG